VAGQVRLRYAHQGGRYPPLIVVYGNQALRLPSHYKRYLENAFREALRLRGTPVRVELRTGTTRSRGKRNLLTPRQAKSKRRLLRDKAQVTAVVSHFGRLAGVAVAAAAPRRRVHLRCGTRLRRPAAGSSPRRVRRVQNAVVWLFRSVETVCRRVLDARLRLAPGAARPAPRLSALWLGSSLSPRQRHHTSECGAAVAVSRGQRETGPDVGDRRQLMLVAD